MQPTDEPRISGSANVSLPTGARGAPRNQPDHVAGAGGVTFNGVGHVLVLRHTNGNWVFPKGHVEPGETLLQAALREVQEEAGVTAVCPEPERTWRTSYRNAYGVDRRISWFVCQAEDSTVNLTETIFEEALFAPPHTAVQLLTFEADKKLLETVMSDLGLGPSEQGSVGAVLESEQP